MPRVWFNSCAARRGALVDSVRRDEDEDGIPIRGRPLGKTRRWEKYRDICVGWEGTCGVGTAADLLLNAKIAGVP